MWWCCSAGDGRPLRRRRDLLEHGRVVSKFGFPVVSVLASWLVGAPTKPGHCPRQRRFDGDAPLRHGALIVQTDRK